MQTATLIFDKPQRRMISDEIRGVRPGSYAVANHGNKIVAILDKKGIQIARKTVHQQLFWATNNQDTYRAAFEVLRNERPDQLRELFNGKLESIQQVSLADLAA